MGGAATIVAGSMNFIHTSILLCVAIGKGLYRLYKYFFEKEQIFESSEKVKVSEDKPLKREELESLVPKWKPLLVSEAELKTVKILTKALFEKKV